MTIYTQQMQGKLQGWFESGCLRTTEKVEYLPFGDKPDWAQGYLELHVNKSNGHFFCIPHFIIRYEAFHNGVRYAA